MKTSSKLLFLFFILIAFDQAAKRFFFASVCNKNIAWSIPVPPAIFYLAWIVIAALLIYIYLKNKKYHQKIFLTFILAGAASNMIDRIRFGCVVDYINLKFWPAFNLADVYITIGVIFLIALNLRKYKIPDTKY